MERLIGVVDGQFENAMHEEVLATNHAELVVKLAVAVLL